MRERTVGHKEYLMHPAFARPTIIGYRRNGSPIYLIAGGSEPPVGDQDQDDQQDDDAGDLGDLLGDDDADGDGSGDQPPAWWAAASAAIETKLTSQIDRRINQLGRRRQGQQQQERQQQEPPAAQGPSSADVREARSVFREVIGEAGLQLSPVEREVASAIAGTAIRAELGTDGDPDAVGTRVATAVADQMKRLRRTHQEQLLRQLEQRGALDRSKLKPGAPQGSQRQDTAAKDWAAGVAKGREVASRRGLVVPEQQRSSGA